MEDIPLQLLKTKNCVSFSDKHEFEVKPDKYSPVYVNLKSTLSNFQLRNLIVQEMAKLVPEVTHICGIESGGSYYASALSDVLEKEFLLYRTKRKGYGIKNSLVGSVPEKGDRLVLIDDVLATGTTMSTSAREFMENEISVSILTIFSYGFDDQIAGKYGVEVMSLIKFDDLVNTARAHSYITPDQEKIVGNYLSTYLDII